MIRRMLLQAIAAAALTAALPAAHAQKQVELSFYYPVAVGGPVTKTIDQMAADFEKDHPDIRIKPVYAGTYQESIVKALTAFKSGQPPHLAVLLSTDMFTLIDEGAIVPIDSLATSADDSQWLSGFFDSFFTPINVMMNAFTPAIVALVLFYAFSLQLKWFPLGRAHDPNLFPGWDLRFIGSVLYHATLPVLSIFIVSFGGWHLGMRNVMINLLNEDFVILARAKGLSDRRVRYRYVARNAILPQITALALSVGFLIGGALVTEQVFNYPGLGKFTFNAIQSRDYSFIQGQLLLLTMSVLVANLLSDIANVILDPRLRKG